MTKYRITAIAHNRNFFTAPDRCVFEMEGEFGIEILSINVKQKQKRF